MAHRGTLLSITLDGKSFNVSQDMDDSTEALEASIEKWEQIVKSPKALDRGTGNCALCEKYWSLLSECTYCPVKQKNRPSGL